MLQSEAVGARQLNRTPQPLTRLSERFGSMGISRIENHFRMHRPRSRVLGYCVEAKRRIRLGRNHWLLASNSKKTQLRAKVGQSDCGARPQAIFSGPVVAHYVPRGTSTKKPRHP
jgi:hypothetical protein